MSVPRRTATMMVLCTSGKCLRRKPALGRHRAPLPMQCQANAREFETAACGNTKCISLLIVYIIIVSYFVLIIFLLVLGNSSLLLWKTNHFSLWAIERKRFFSLLHVWRFTASFVLPLAQTYMASRLFHILAIECTEPAKDPEMSCNHMQSSFVLPKLGYLAR